MLHIPIFPMNTCVSHIQFFVTQRFVHKIEKNNGHQLFNGKLKLVLVSDVHLYTSFMSSMCHPCLTLFCFKIVAHLCNKPCREALVFSFTLILLVQC